MRKKKWIALLVVLSLGISLLGGCKAQDASVEKLKDLDFTVMEEEDLPQELKELVEEKKAAPFKLSYSDSQYLYIAVGYGEQKTGGYSVTVDELYVTKNAIYIDTSLIGPEKGELVTQAITHPYVVVKTEFMDVNVVFE